MGALEPVPFVPQWVMDQMDVPDCSVCGVPVMSKQPTHTICRMAMIRHTGCIPVTFIVGMDPEDIA